jgi:hypothetical protein
MAQKKNLVVRTGAAHLNLFDECLTLQVQLALLLLQQFDLRRRESKSTTPVQPHPRNHCAHLVFLLLNILHE